MFLECRTFQDNFARIKVLVNYLWVKWVKLLFSLWKTQFVNKSKPKLNYSESFVFHLECILAPTLLWGIHLMWQVTIVGLSSIQFSHENTSMLITQYDQVTVERCDHVDDQVATESPSTGGWRRGVSAGVWVSAVAWLGPHSFLVSHTGMEWAELGVTGPFPGPSAQMCISGRAIIRSFPHLDYFQLRFIADDKKILISRLMTT